MLRRCDRFYFRAQREIQRPPTPVERYSELEIFDFYYIHIGNRMVWFLHPTKFFRFRKIRLLNRRKVLFLGSSLSLAAEHFVDQFDKYLIMLWCKLGKKKLSCPRRRHWHKEEEKRVDCFFALFVSSILRSVGFSSSAGRCRGSRFDSLLLRRANANAPLARLANSIFVSRFFFISFDFASPLTGSLFSAARSTSYFETSYTELEKS